jgi:hypothetical protein
MVRDEIGTEKTLIIFISYFFQERERNWGSSVRKEKSNKREIKKWNYSSENMSMSVGNGYLKA